MPDSTRIYILRKDDHPVISARYRPDGNEVVLEGAHDPSEAMLLAQNDRLVHVGCIVGPSSSGDEVFAIKPDGYVGSVPEMQKIVEAASSVVRRTYSTCRLLVKNEIVVMLPQQ